jgi:hypothetical protein
MDVAVLHYCFLQRVSQYDEVAVILLPRGESKRPSEQVAFFVEISG